MDPDLEVDPYHQCLDPDPESESLDIPKRVDIRLQSRIQGRIQGRNCNRSIPHLRDDLSCVGLVGVLDELDGQAEVLAAVHAAALELKCERERGSSL